MFLLFHLFTITYLKNIHKNSRVNMVLEAEDPFACEKPGPKGPRHIDYDALQQHVADFPDFTLAERAQHFGASTHGIFYALSKLNITRKKNDNLQRTVSGETPRVSLNPSARDTAASEKTGLY